MSYFSIDGKPARLYGKRASQSIRDLDFDVSGDRFPQASFPGVTLYEDAKHFRVVSTRPNRLHVNYGDGTTTTFNSFVSGSLHYIDIKKAQDHLYTDGFTGRRIVVITIEDVKAVVEVFVQHVKLYGSIPAHIDKLTEMKTFRLNFTYEVERIIESFINLPKLEVISYSTAFKAGSELATKIPLAYFNKPIKQFGNSRADYSGSGSNVDKINQWAATLETLSLSYCNLSTLPNNFSELVNLKSLNIDTNLWSETPPIVNSIPSLTSLSIGGGATGSTTFLSYGDFRNLVNLNTLTAWFALNLTTSIPAWFSQLTKLKTFRLDQNFQTLARVDEFINNFYAFVIANAPIAGISTDPFRNMNLNINHTHPSGIYQQPAGYVAGSNNGAPASPLEKIWVMVNQYAHTWTYTP